MSSDGSAVGVNTVGSLLAVIANAIQDALRVLMFADKRAWGSPEFEQLRLLEDTLDEAKRDFQELPALVNGRFYYENDRKADSLDELHELCARFQQHSQNFKYWVRAGGPIDPEWATETRWLRRELHRAQCRAVRRIHDDLEGSSSRPRCLGALIVWRSQQRQQSHISHSHLPPHPSQPQRQQRHPSNSQRGASITTTSTTSTIGSDRIQNGEIIACNTTGKFQRLAPENRDIAFVCDFCDGFLVWEDLRSMPSTRQEQQQHASASSTSMHENWAATGFSHPRSTPGSSTRPLTTTGSDVELEDRRLRSFQTTTTARELYAEVEEAETELRGEEKTVVFPPVAIANHLPPDPGEWQAPLLCPLCDEYYYEEQGDGDMDRVRYTQDERGFESVAALQEHFEWTHASLIPSLATVTSKTSSCQVM